MAVETYTNMHSNLNILILKGRFYSVTSMIIWIIYLSDLIPNTNRGIILHKRVK